MALPDNLTDLFRPKDNQPDLSKIAGIQQLGYKVTWDAVDDGTVPPELQSQFQELLEAVRTRPDRRLVEQLQQLVRQYPDVPTLKNYLMLAYVQTGQKSRANELLEQTIQQHPRYLLGLANKAHQLLTKEDTAGVESLFGGPLTDISLFYPERTEFHVSEVANFTHVAFGYYLAKNDPDAAENRLRLLRDLGYHNKDQLRNLKEQLDIARMRYNMERMQAGFEDAVTIEGYFRAEDQQTTEPPAFEHSEIQWLYEYGLIETDKPLPADKRDALLALPRPSLTRDSSKALLDTVYRYEHFMEQDWDDSRHNFAGHALLLATELRANECLDAVLETLRQDGEFREFWWGDWLTDFYEPYFRRMLPDHADALKAFMLEPDVNTYSKTVVSEAVMQEVLVNPAFKPAAQAWYTDVLTHLINHADDEHLFDPDLIAFVIGDITGLQLTDLLPLIRVAYGRSLVTENIHGDLNDTERDMVTPMFPPDRRPLRPIAEQYEYLHDPVAYRKAHPEPAREKLRDDFMDELEAKQDEWTFLYEGDEEEPSPNGILFPSQQKPSFFTPSQPVVKQPTPNRNDKVSVRYTNGTIVRDVKYKKVESDVQSGKCELL